VLIIVMGGILLSLHSSLPSLLASLKPSFAPRFTLPPLVPSEAYEVNTLENVESIAQLTEAERDDGEANNRGQIRRN